MTARLGTLGTACVAACGLAIAPVPALGQTSGNYALSFNGVDALVTVPNHPLLELTDGTLELWFKPDWAPESIAYDPALIAKRLGPNLTRYSLHVDRNLAGVMLANGISVSTVPYAFTRGQWYHLALSESGATAQVYVNGQFIGSTTNGFGTVIGLPLNLGSDGAGQFFRGAMDEVRIWNVARSATDIRYNLSRALAGTEAGLVAYWRMSEGIDTTVTDVTANRLDGTLFGPVWSNSDVVLVNTSGSFGLALDLSASRSNCVHVASAPSLALSNRFTFEAWIKPRRAQCSTILARGDGANFAATDYIFQVGTDGTNCGVMKLALMVAGGWVASASAVPTNAWAHMAVSYDGAAAQFYINGLLDRAVPRTGSASQSGAPLFIGRQGLAGGNFFDGALDEVRVWNTARSAVEIQTNLNRTLPRNQPELIGYWRFDEQAGIGAFDSSGRGNHGTLLYRPMRIGSLRVPVVTLNGANPQMQECHTAFTNPGAAASGGPVNISAGYEYSLVLKADTTVIAWGRNDSGQTNVPTSATNIVAIATGSDSWHSLALKVDGTVLGWGNNYDGEINVPASATNIIAVAAGTAHSLVLKADGTVLAWGYNGDGQTNVPASATNIVAIAGGGGHSLVLRADGTVLAWGRNDSGQTAVPASATGVVAIAAGYSHSLALKADGTVLAWSGQANVPPSATNITAIAAGSGHSLALKADGTVLGWGNNSYGQTTIPASVSTLNLGVIVRGSVNANVPGAYVLTYNTTNAAGAVGTATRTVIVVDTTPPVLTLAGANPLNVDVGTPFVDPGASATDLCDGTLTSSIVRTGTVNATVPGSYTLTYTVTDSSGNTATTNRTVLVRGWPSVLSFTAFFSGTNVITGSPVVQFLADVNPNGLATVAFTQYGLSTTYPGRTTSVNLPASYEVSTFYATLDGLMPGYTYHFRIAASNNLGVTYGPDQTFTVPLLFGAGDLNGDRRVDQSELNSVLSNYWPSSPWLVMTNPATLGGGLLQFALTNAGGWNFTVLASTNLTNWDPLPAVAWPVWQFHDPAATNLPHRFYRLRWP